MMARFVWLLVMAFPALPTAARQPEPPNVLIILADDLGWADTGVYGSTYYETPAIDRLASEGMRFTDAYAEPLCSPGRAALLSGQYPARVRLMRALTRRPTETEGHVPARAAPTRKVVEPVDRTRMPLEVRTVAEALRDAGYNTYHLGKWHLSDSEQTYPHHQGFDTVVGVGGPGPGSYFSPYRIPMLADGPPGEYLGERLSRETIQILENETVREGPFFIYLAQPLVHGPWEAQQEWVNHFTRKLTTASRNNGDPTGGQRTPVAAAMIRGLDESVGCILARLDELGLAENTIVLFTSDNGGVVHIENPVPVTSNYPLRDGKASIYEGGIRVPFLLRWPGRVAPATVNPTPVHLIDLFPTLLEAAGAGPEPALDGRSLLPILTGTGRLERNELFFHFPWYMGAGQTPASAVREGDYKLIRYWGEGPGRTDRHALYNLADDPGEGRDLAAAQPERVGRMSRRLDQWLQSTGALTPALNPDYREDARTKAASADRKARRKARSRTPAEAP